MTVNLCLGVSLCVSDHPPLSDAPHTSAKHPPWGMGPGVRVRVWLPVAVGGFVTVVGACHCVGGWGASPVFYPLPYSNPDQGVQGTWLVAVAPKDRPTAARYPPPICLQHTIESRHRTSGVELHAPLGYLGTTACCAAGIRVMLEFGKVASGLSCPVWHT